MIARPALGRPRLASACSTQLRWPGAARQLRAARRRPTPTRRSAASCASSSASRCTSTAPASRAGNVQAWARDVRYAVALELTDGDVATGHTATDQVETVLYRLAASPGRRALLGMREREGRVVRPLLHMTREETAAHCRARGLAVARGRLQRRPALRPQPRARRPRPRAARAAPRRRGQRPRHARDPARRGRGARRAGRRTCSPGRDAIPPAELAALPPALRRLVFIELAGAPVGHRVDEVLALAPRRRSTSATAAAPRCARGVVRVGSLPT